MREVLISIQPKWCELIANGSKIIEVRKTKPKLETPFKCYIYCTKSSKKYQTVAKPMVLNDDELFKLPNGKIKYGNSIELIGYDDYSEDNFLNGKVIGEFVCDNIFSMSITYSDPNNRMSAREFSFTCLTYKQIIDYLGNGKRGYGWHISDLVIYDKPKALSEFAKPCNYNCFAPCPYYRGKEYDCEKPVIMRAPQSWCYVEG
mgnify:CR=1 FL=1